MKLLLVLNIVLTLCLVVVCICYVVVAAKTPVLVIGFVDEGVVRMDTCTLYPLCIERISTGERFRLYSKQQ